MGAEKVASCMTNILDGYYILIKPRDCPSGKLDPQNGKLITMTADKFLAALKCLSIVSATSKKATTETQTVAVKTETESRQVQTVSELKTEAVPVKKEIETKSIATCTDKEIKPESAKTKRPEMKCASTQSYTMPEALCQKCKGSLSRKMETRSPVYQSFSSTMGSPTEDSLEEHFRKIPEELRNVVVMKDRETISDLMKLNPMSYMQRFLNVLLRVLHAEQSTASTKLLKRFAWLLERLATDFIDNSSRPDRVINLYQKALAIAKNERNWSFRPALEKARSAFRDQGHRKHSTERRLSTQSEGEESRRVTVFNRQESEDSLHAVSKLQLAGDRYKPGQNRPGMRSKSSDRGHKRSKLPIKAGGNATNGTSPAYSCKDDSASSPEERRMSKRQGSVPAESLSPVRQKRHKYDESVYSPPKDPRRAARNSYERAPDQNNMKKNKPKTFQRSQGAFTNNNKAGNYAQGHNGYGYNNHRKICHFFNEKKNGCFKGSNCDFKHICGSCRVPTHGNYNCPVLVEALKKSVKEQEMVNTFT